MRRLCCVEVQGNALLQWCNAERDRAAARRQQDAKLREQRQSRQRGKEQVQVAEEPVHDSTE